MKLTVMKPTEVTAATIQVIVPVRYGTEDIPADFPFRRKPVATDPAHYAKDGYDVWDVTVDVDTGVVRDWPAGVAGKCHMKVCDEGCYHLNGPHGEPLATIGCDYVPGCIPGEYGEYGDYDYVGFDIGPDGAVKDWHRWCTPDGVAEWFFPGDE